MAAESEPAGSDSLLSLPVELMEAVANELPSEDLLSLRLVCKDTESKVLRIFTSRCFTEKSFLLGSSWSMEALESISQHPQFSIPMMRITLDLREIVSATTDERVQRKAQKIGSGEARLDREARIKHRELRKRHQALQTQHKQFMTSSKWATMLFNSLRNFAARNLGGIALKVSSVDEHLGAAPCGLARLQRTLGYKHCIRNSYAMSRYCKRIARCILETGCPLEELSMPERASVAIEAFTAASSPHADLTIFSISSICKLYLSLDVFQRYTDAGSNGLRSMLTTSPKLRFLKLSITRGHDGTNNHFYSKVMSNIYMPSLEQADLIIGFPSRHEVIDFIHAHRKTLQLLTLSAYQDWRHTSPLTNSLDVDAQHLKVQADAGSLDLQLVWIY
jgi:hypothetical protein